MSDNRLTVLELANNANMGVHAVLKALNAMDVFLSSTDKVEWQDANNILALKMAPKRKQQGQYRELK